MFYYLNNGSYIASEDNLVGLQEISFEEYNLFVVAQQQKLIEEIKEEEARRLAFLEENGYFN